MPILGSKKRSKNRLLVINLIKFLALYNSNINVNISYKL